MPTDGSYEPDYTNSRGLIIGINSYEKIPPLGYAHQDATAVAEVLRGHFGFPDENLTVLLDGEASRAAIMSAFLSFAADSIARDDRIVVFFAGHGYTRTARRGEVGYLAPVDGDPDDLSTLIRWDDLTRNADLFKAKHLLFLMDACYGGLALVRALQPGSSRYLKDMMRRYSRQVLTAGKADEVVADCGGPRAGHSIFTGHLLDALEGAAASSDGIISANAVIAYVCDRVAKDPHSHQSPHYGFLDGDGDLIFHAPNVHTLSSDGTADQDILIQVPATITIASPTSTEPSFSELVKEYLSDSRFRIRLDDLSSTEIRAVLAAFNGEAFSSRMSAVTPETFANRLLAYEQALTRLADLTILLSRWGNEEHQAALAKIVARLADGNEPRDGSHVLVELRWYPLSLLMYYGGISALSSQNYRNLTTLMTTRLGTRVAGQDTQAAIVPTVLGMLEITRSEWFKRLPGHERHFVPDSEYLFKAVQPHLEDQLFLGNSYEDLFDRYEIFQALIYADLTRTESATGVWGPPGRFAWKHRRGHNSPFDALISEADASGSKWPPLQFGLFAGSIERFKETATAYGDLLHRLPWV
jgi:Caspase domain